MFLERKIKHKKRKPRITDMNADCIEHVLELLDFEDLLRVAESNKVLNSVAGRVLQHRFPSHRLTLVLDGFPFGSRHSNKDYRIDDGTIYALNFEASLKLLKHFGRFFSQIALHYKHMSSKERRTIEYNLSKYCSDQSASLTELILEDGPASALNSIKKPLKSVQSVTITGESDLDFKMLNKTLPNMNHLKLKWIQVPDGGCIKRTFPSLKYLEMEVYDRINTFSTRNVLHVMDMNPQLDRIAVEIHQHPKLNFNLLLDYYTNYQNAPVEGVVVIPGATI